MAKLHESKAFLFKLLLMTSLPVLTSCQQYKSVMNVADDDSFFQRILPIVVAVAVFTVLCLAVAIFIIYRYVRSRDHTETESVISDIGKSLGIVHYCRTGNFRRFL